MKIRPQQRHIPISLLLRLKYIPTREEFICQILNFRLGKTKFENSIFGRPNFAYSGDIHDIHSRILVWNLADPSLKIQYLAGQILMTQLISIFYRTCFYLRTSVQIVRFTCLTLKSRAVSEIIRHLLENHVYTSLIIVPGFSVTGEASSQSFFSGSRL